MTKNTSLKKRDEENYHKRSQTNNSITYAFDTLKINPIKLLSQFIKVRKKSKITIQEYIEFGLYKDDKDFEQKKKFISGKLHWPIVAKTCDKSYESLTEDKYLFEVLFSNTNIKAPKTIAIIDKTNRIFPGAIKLKTEKDFKEFILKNKSKKIFAKENHGIAGFGAFLVVDADNDKLKLENHGWITYGECFKDLIADTTYVLQEKLANHSFFNDITTNLATIRVGSYSLAGDIIIPYAVLKIPSKENIVDHFWRPGNFSCNVDVVTGTIKSVKERETFGVRDCEPYKHLIGQTLPHWKNVIKIAKDSAKILPMIKYQSLDIALTSKGPVVIELNSGGAFELPQITSGEGLLTPSFVEFLKENKYEL